MAHKIMSMEAALDEERKEVLALLESTASGRPSGSASFTGGSARTGSPFATPRSPVRSMLDVDVAIPRHKSLPGTSGTGVSSPPIRSMLDIDSPPPVRSMLDISTPLSSTAAPKKTVPDSPRGKITSSKSSQSSPIEGSHRAVPVNRQQYRSLSDSASRPADFGSRAPGFEAPSPYQISGYVQNNPGASAVPKRNTQAGKKAQVPSTMAEVVRGGDLGSFGPRDRGRHSLAGTGLGNHIDKSLSPNSRLGLRSNSPHSNILNSDLSTFRLDDGTVIDMNSAYRHLSDANLARSGGGLSTLSVKSRRSQTNSGEAMTAEETGDGRLEKDYTGGDEAEDSSDEENRRSSDEERSRGRKKEKSEKTRDDDPESHTVGMGRAKGPRTARSLMAAAEEERVEVAAKYKVRSLLEPEITVTKPSGEKARSSKTIVHPSTAFDDRSGLNTPLDSDTEADLTDIKRAQKLSVHMTTITSTPATKRSVRTIYRGDFAKMQQEAHEDQRRIRKYLVATDLSDEAAHALEWTVGTVLRDGDTLLAIYCVDEELGIASSEGSADDQLKEQATAVVSATKASSTPALNASPAPSPLGRAFRLETGSASASPMGRERGKAEQERYRAVQDITDRVSKLLRKTKLQVKVVIEVIHCKSPKHLITEVIDFLNPTLVILGSRGRSALKGVILGSFSNYIVTKSSVPVMVARKRLRKHTKVKRSNIKLANNLSNPVVRGLANASIDIPL